MESIISGLSRIDIHSTVHIQLRMQCCFALGMTSRTSIPSVGHGLATRGMWAS